MNFCIKRVVLSPTVFAGFDGISSEELANLNKDQLRAFAAIFSDLSKVTGEN